MFVDSDWVSMEKIQQQLPQIRQEDFEREVLLSSTPTVVDFYADWCGPCRAVGPIIEGLSDEFRGRAKFVKVNTDDNQQLSEKYGIMSIPTVSIFVDGKIVDSVFGTAPAQVYRNKIEAVLREQAAQTVTMAASNNPTKQQFSCPVCGASFANQNELMDHKAKAHPM